jgi:hypothetical protein
MTQEADRLQVQLELDDGASPEEIERLTAAMRRELLQLDVAAVDRVPGEAAPEGAKAGLEIAAVGALMVTLGNAGSTLEQIVATMRSWASRSSDRTVKLSLDGDTLEVGGMSEEDQRHVIDSWMERHTRK